MDSITKSISNVIPLPSAVAVALYRDIPVFPCRANKTPYTHDGFKSATQNPDVIKEWWKQYPDAMIGMPTSKVSGYVIVDVDDKNGKCGTDSLHKLETTYGKLPDTWTTLTPSGGIHYWFKYPGKKIHTSASKIDDGLDIRGDGGYAIIPPSKGYQWEISNPVECALMPEWLIKLCNAKRKRNKQHNKQDELIERIKRKDTYLDRLSPVSNVTFPEGDYPAEFVGWQASQHGKFILKKGQLRTILRFKVFAGDRDYQINAYRTINVLHDGRLSVGASNRLGKDLSSIAGHHEDGFPVQIDLDDIDLSILADKQLYVSIHNTAKSRIKRNGKWVFTETKDPYGHISKITAHNSLKSLLNN